MPGSRLYRGTALGPIFGPLSPHFLPLGETERGFRRTLSSSTSALHQVVADGRAQQARGEPAGGSGRQWTPWVTRVPPFGPHWLGPRSKSPGGGGGVPGGGGGEGRKKRGRSGEVEADGAGLWQAATTGRRPRGGAEGYRMTRALWLQRERGIDWRPRISTRGSHDPRQVRCWRQGIPCRCFGRARFRALPRHLDGVSWEDDALHGTPSRPEHRTWRARDLHESKCSPRARQPLACGSAPKPIPDGRASGRPRGEARAAPTGGAVTR